MLLKEGLPRLKQYTENLHEDKQGIVPTQTKLGKLCKYKNQTAYPHNGHSHSEMLGFFGLFGAVWVGELGPQPGSMGPSAPRGRPGATSS